MVFFMVSGGVGINNLMNLNRNKSLLIIEWDNVLALNCE